MDNTVRVADSPVHGRGVFAARMIEAGESFCANHLFRVSADEREFLDQTSLYDHYFEYGDDAYIALGPITFLNHHDRPCADFELDPENLTVSLTALRRIDAAEEITIHYGTDPWW